MSPARILILLTLLSGVPFLNQAFHIDDRIYLEFARNIDRKPFHPYDYPPVFEGIEMPDAASHSRLPLTAYYLAVIRALSPTEREWAIHLAFLLFPLLAVTAFYDLARSFVDRPFPATLLFLGAPAFGVLSQTIMTDVAMLAFWLLTLSRFVRICRGSPCISDRFVLLLSLAAASFISLLSAGLLLLMGAYLLAGGGEKNAAGRGFWTLVFLLPLLLWSGWYGKQWLHYDRFVLIDTMLHVGKRESFQWGVMTAKAASFAVNAGGAFLAPLVLWYGFPGRRKWLAGLTAGLAAWAVFRFFIPEWTGFYALLLGVFVGSGTVLLAAFVQLLIQPRSPEDRLLALWFLGIFASCLILFYSGSVRYALPALPPVILLWVRNLESRVSETYFLRNLLWAGVLATFLYAIPIRHADYRFAGMYRDAAAEIAADYGSAENAIWFTGEWGFRYYMEREGGLLLTRTGVGPAPGDVIVKPFVASPWVTLYDGAPHSRLLEQRIPAMGTPLRILDFSSHAGFYSTGWGILPISWNSGEPAEWFNVFQVLRPYDGPVPEPERHW
ncbi:MAG TPA: glycosyltransferase family 39 protein [Acidobacteriota bacterium]|nr:glycosyltransferase family 39 protein [Acidobacteriota bacterium]